MYKTISGEVEISLEAVKIFVNEVFSETHKIVNDEDTNLRVIVPTTFEGSSVTYNYTDEAGFFLTDSKGVDVTSSAKVVCFDGDTNEKGNYLVQGIAYGTLTIAGKNAIETDDILRLVEIEQSL